MKEGFWGSFAVLYPWLNPFDAAKVSCDSVKMWQWNFSGNFSEKFLHCRNFALKHHYFASEFDDESTFRIN